MHLPAMHERPAFRLSKIVAAAAASGSGQNPPEHVAHSPQVAACAEAEKIADKTTSIKITHERITNPFQKIGYCFQNLLYPYRSV